MRGRRYSKTGKALKEGKEREGREGDKKGGGRKGRERS